MSSELCGAILDLSDERCPLPRGHGPIVYAPELTPDGAEPSPAIFEMVALVGWLRNDQFPPAAPELPCPECGGPWYVDGHYPTCRFHRNTLRSARVDAGEPT